MKSNGKLFQFLAATAENARTPIINGTANSKTLAVDDCEMDHLQHNRDEQSDVLELYRTDAET